jgi:hypothetical protein
MKSVISLLSTIGLNLDTKKLDSTMKLAAEVEGVDAAELEALRRVSPRNCR